MCLNVDSEACGCGIDMVDGALETLDLTLFKRGMFEFASYVFFDVGWLEMDRFFDCLCFLGRGLRLGEMESTMR